MTEAAAQHYGWLSVLPALAVIVLAVWSKRVVEPLFAGIAAAAWVMDYNANGLGHSLLYLVPNAFALVAGHPATETLKGVGMVKDAGRAQVLISILLLGSLIAVIERSGGAQAFANRAAKRIRSQTGAMLTSLAIGLAMFTSAYFSVLINGAAMKPIFDRMKISREKLALFCDCTSVPAKTLIPLSGWIGFMAILIEENIPAVPPGEGFSGFVRTIPYNFYCWAMLLWTLLLALKLVGDFGPMREAEERTKKGVLHKPGSTPMVDPKVEEEAKKLLKDGDIGDMLLPLGASTICLVVLGMWNGFYVKWFPGLSKLALSSPEIMTLAFASGLFMAMIKYAWKGLIPAREFLDVAFEGGKSTLIGAVMILLAVTLGDLMGTARAEGLGTAPFIAQTSEPYLAQGWIPAISFLVAAAMSFAMGTSWGVWSIMMPISIPLALGAGINPFIVAGAVLSGGAFGDHCSPISDTAVLSSLAANTDHMEHIRTQLPYALAMAGVALVGYAVFGWLL